MISSLRVKAELQRSGPQPLVGMSQRFPNKAMVTWREGGGGDGRAGHIQQLPTAQAPRGRLCFPGGTNQKLATSSHQGLIRMKASEPRQARRHSRLHTAPWGHGHRRQETGECAPRNVPRTCNAGTRASLPGTSTTNSPPARSSGSGSASLTHPPWLPTAYLWTPVPHPAPPLAPHAPGTPSITVSETYPHPFSPTGVPLCPLPTARPAFNGHLCWQGALRCPTSCPFLPQLGQASSLASHMSPASSVTALKPQASLGQATAPRPPRAQKDTVGQRPLHLRTGFPQDRTLSHNHEDPGGQRRIFPPLGHPQTRAQCQGCPRQPRTGTH